MFSYLQLPPGQEPGQSSNTGFLWAAPGFSSYSPRKEHGQNDWLPPQPQFCVLVMHVTPIVKGDHVLYEPCLYLSWAVQTNRETWKRTRADGWASSTFVSCLRTLCSSAKLCHTPDESVATYLFLDFSLQSRSGRVLGHYESTWEFCKSLVNSQMLYYFWYLLERSNKTPEA